MPESKTDTPEAKPKGHGRAVAIRLAVVLVLLGAVSGGVWGLTHAAQRAASPTTMEIPALSVDAADVKPGSVAPVNTTLKGKAKPGKKQKPTTRRAGGLEAWAAQTSSATGVSARALLAYGRAEIATRESQPGCKVSWATLAGIGRVESNHGQFGGAVLQANGWPTKPIVGVPLDGSGGFRAISDTDGGKYDGDTKVDRAVGPMQFIPSTWASWSSDGNGDGKSDPQQMDDAALAAARYLCAGGRDMSTADGWWAGLWSYNRSTEYAQKVFGLADQYARSVKG